MNNSWINKRINKIIINNKIELEYVKFVMIVWFYVKINKLNNILYHVLTIKNVLIHINWLREYNH